LQDAQDRQARDEQSTTLEELWDERHAGSVVETPSMSPGPSAEATSVSATRSEESLALSREIHALRGMVELLAAQRERELAGVGGSGGVGSHHGHGRGISMEEQRARLRDRLQEIARAKLAIGAIYQRMDYPDAGAAVVLLDQEMAELNRVKEAVRLLEASELAQQSQQIDSLLQKVIDLEQKDTVEDAKEQQPYYAEPPMMPRSPPRQEFASPDAGTGIVLASLMQKISQLEAKEAENAAAVEKVLITSQMNAMMDKINRLQTERGGRSKSAESEHEAHMVLVQQLDQYKARYDESEREVRALRDSERALRDRLVLLDRAEQHVREVEERSRRSEEQARHTIEGLEGSVRRLQESEQQMMSSNANDTEATERQISHFKAQLASLHQVENENTRSRSTVESLRLKLGDAERRAEDSVKALAAMKYSAAEQISELKAQLAGANQRMEAHMQVSQSGDREALAQLRAAQNDMQGLRGELEEQKALVVETRKAAFTNESKLREDLLQSVLREKAHAHDDHLSADRQMSDIREQLTSAERRRTASAAETANLKAELERAANQIRKLKAKEDEHLQRLNVTQESSSTLQDELNVEKERSQHLFEEREIEQSKYRHKVHELTERVRKAELKGHEILEAFKKTKGAHEKVREALELQKQSELHKINEQLETLRIAYEDEKEEVVSLRERLGSSTAEGEDFQATVQILQQRNDELETENEKLKKRKGKGMSASKPHWGGTSAHNEEFSHVRCWGGLLSARGKSCVSVSHSLT